jgi:methylenetetrahydrofolate--tRNA-(uracil-5-)-methyltransferase
VRAIGEDQLAYYDAIAPIVSAESIDSEKTFRQSRYDKGGDDAYINCPMNAEEYYAFIDALVASEKVAPRAFEEARYFEGCLPVEVMASRGKDTLAYGPMKPVGLTDPRTGRTPYAVVQLRQEDFAATAYNLVGFQTRMTYGAQAKVFRMIPGLESAEFVRFGTVHRNTFVNAPRVLTPAMELKASPGVFLAGQITGVEGYVESAGGGFLCALLLAQRLSGRDLAPPPPTTALGGLLTHLQTPREDFQPSNLTWALLPPVVDPKVKKLPKHVRLERGAQRALDDLAAWLPLVAEGFAARPLTAAEPVVSTSSAAECASSD